MVGVAGFEPATFCPPDKRATRLRYTPNKTGRSNKIVIPNWRWAPFTQLRFVPNLTLQSNVMYQIFIPTNDKKYNSVIFFIIGRGNKIRTCDLYVPNVALYQTELCPVSENHIINIKTKFKYYFCLCSFHALYTISPAVLCICSIGVLPKKSVIQKGGQQRNSP